MCDRALGAGREGRHEVRPALGYHGNRLVVDVEAVLDRVDAGPDRVLHALRGVRVAGHALANGVGLVHERVELLVGPIAPPDLLAVRTRAASVLAYRSRTNYRSPETSARSSTTC